MNLTAALEALTVPELRQLAAEVNLTGRSRLRKAELVATLAENLVIETLVAIRYLPSLRPEAAAAEAGRTSDPELRAAELAEAAREPLPLTRRQAEHLVVIDQQRGDVPRDNEGVYFAREDWLTRGRESMEERWLDEPGDNALSDAYRIVLGLMAPAGFTLLLSFIRGEEPGSTTFDSQQAAETYVRQELRDLSSIWRVRVLNPAGETVRLAVRSGYNASGKGWIWATPITDVS
jgi:hypothetical protein